MSITLKIDPLSLKDECVRFIDEQNYINDYACLSTMNLISISKAYKIKSCIFQVFENKKKLGDIYFYITGSFFRKKIFIPNECLIANDSNKNIIVNSLLEWFCKQSKFKEIEIASMKQLSIKNIRPDKKVSLGIDLGISADSLWKKFRDKTRNAIRKSEKYNINIEENLSHLDKFYTIYSSRMQSKSVSFHSHRYFKDLVDSYGGNVKIYIAKYDSKPIASILVIHVGEYASYAYSGIVSGYEKLCPVQGLLWRAIQDCYDLGIKYFDMGQSTEGSGTYKFKKWFGAEPRTIYYYRRKKYRFLYLFKCEQFISNAISKLVYDLMPKKVKRYLLAKRKLKGRLV